MAQNKELKRLKKKAERRKVEEAEEREQEDDEARARAVEEFEKVQAGLSVRAWGKGSERIVGKQNGKVTVEQDTKGTKRKFEVDEDELVRLANDEREKVKKIMSEEKNAKSELPSFWVPSETPDNKKAAMKAIKEHPTCPAAETDQPHEITLKKLVTVNFKEEKKDSNSSETSRTCPSCNKSLSNSTKAVLAKPCGHVLCKPCSDEFQKAPEKSAHDKEHDETVRCYVCQEDVTSGRKSKRKKDDGSGEKESKVERGLVELSSDGTGFAGGGKNMVKKQGVAFQC